MKLYDFTTLCIYYYYFFLHAVLTSEGIVFISDFSPSKAPISSGKKVYISSPHSSPVHNKLVSATGAKKALDKVKILITNEKPRYVLTMIPPNVLNNYSSQTALFNNHALKSHKLDCCIFPLANIEIYILFLSHSK